MLILRGQVANFFTKPESKDQATGEVRPAQSRVQILSPDEIGKLELVELRVHDIDAWKGLDGAQVECPVKMYSVEGSSGLYMAKDAKPVPLKAK